MNILMVNWTWHPSGGDWTYIENMMDLYQENGHHIVPFSMKDERNLPTEYSNFFVDKIDYKEMNRNRSLKNGLQVLKKSIYSTEAIKKLEALLEKVEINLVHINVIHHFITPGILKIFRKHSIPVIWTLHDYTIICPEGTFLNHNMVCERCIHRKFYMAVVHRCKRGSVLASSVAAFENYVHSALNYYAYVDYYICPSEFSYRQFKKFDFFPEKLVQLYNSYQIKEYPVSIQEKGSKYILFVGRLEKLKGVYTLLDAMIRLPGIKLKMAGDGTEAEALAELIRSRGIHNVELLGKRAKSEILELINSAEFLICPSEWYEVLGFTIVEAMLLGKPVIGAAIGAIPESIVDGQTGLLFSPGNSSQLAEKINYLNENPELIVEMGKKAKLKMQKMVDPGQYYQKLKSLIPAL